MGCIQPAFANSPQEKLVVLQRVLDSETKDNAKYRAAEKEAAVVLKELQDKLITQTAELQQTEQAVQDLQDKQAATTQSITNLQTELTHQHAKLASLLMAAQRLQRVPPEAMLLRPGEPIDAARTNLLLQRATPEIAQQAGVIKADLAHLAQLKSDLDTQQADLTKLQHKQQKQQTALTKDIQTREKWVATNAAKKAKSDDKIADLKQQQASLKQMLADLAKHEQSLRDAKPVRRATKTTVTAQDDTDTDVPDRKSGWGQSLLSFFRGHGPAKMPVTGQIRTGYDQKLASGARSQGLYIAGSAGGIVIAPESGTVRFAGPFRQYRLLVIIEHADGYHSLLGGLQDVYPEVGASVAAGEPIGKLPANNQAEEGDAAHANLYYEVRHDGKPVDPRSLRG